MVAAMADGTPTWSASILATDAPGDIFSLTATDDRIVAVGGTSSAFLLVSSNGRTFTRRAAPSGVGLRRVLPGPDGSFFVAGEYGTFARTDDDGATWTDFDTGTSSCLFGLGRAD